MKINPKKELAIFAAIFFAAAFAVYLVLNGGAYFRILRYDLVVNSPFGSDLKNWPILGLSGAVEKPSGSENDYYLAIPKTATMSPIVFPKDGDNKTILAAMESGVAFYPGSQQFGENGRSVILGHSSKAIWYRGDYGSIFALLHKLEKGDEVYVFYGNKKLAYKVFADDVLTPAKTNELLAQIPQGESDIALITCWPVGSSSMRTVIQAKLESAGKI